jgi:hypothetical protein
MLQSHFRLRASELSEAELATDQDELTSVIRTAAQFSPVGSLQSVFDQASLQRHLDKVHEWAAAVWYKYVLSQPVVVAVVEADRLGHEEIIGLARRFDNVVLEMRDVTGKLGLTRLSVTGIILLVFFDHAAATTFVERTQRKCKIWHFFKKTWVLPWLVDVSNKSVKSHAGLPFLPGVLNADHLQKQIFA